MPAPTPGITLYTGGPGNSTSRKEKSFELPITPAAPPAGTNVKIWLYNPEDKTKSLGSTSIFYFTTAINGWVVANGNSDGSLYANWQVGKYQIDTIEPNNNTKDYSRKRYELEVTASGEVLVTGLLPNSQGFFTMTAIKNQPKLTYLPDVACKLADQTTDLRTMVGFPKRDYRLPSNGKINALIIPIDFSDVPGKGKPEEVFTAMTDEMARFFYAQSGGRVQFNFQSLKDWVRAPFLSTTYNLGKWNGGDSNGYYGAALALADPLVDYSLFDVVYVLSPREIPASSIAYGPAFVSRPGDSYSMTNEGLVRNGSISGADAWNAGVSGSAWKWIAHETGHLFGLHDLYTMTPNGPYGSWDIMSLNWTEEALALNSWNRYLQGWLADNQVNCLVREKIEKPIDQVITPIERDAEGIKSVMVKLTDSKILVLESRRNAGYDSLSEAREGVLVFTVDMTIPSIKGGWSTQRRPGSTMVDYSDAALKAGDIITVEGVRIEVLKRDSNGDQVRISRG
jgi:M6 family metalloprotease-like protein